MNYDLGKRTEKFSEAIIEVCKRSERNPVVSPIVAQLIRSGTSIGANYCEANGACSRKDFKNKMYICKKEAQETEYWLKMLGKAAGRPVDNLQCILQESRELVLIFNKISNTLKSSEN